MGFARPYGFLFEMRVATLRLAGSAMSFHSISQAGLFFPEGFHRHIPVAANEPMPHAWLTAIPVRPVAETCPCKDDLLHCLFLNRHTEHTADPQLRKSTASGVDMAIIPEQAIVRHPLICCSLCGLALVEPPLSRQCRHRLFLYLRGDVQAQAEIKLTGQPAIVPEVFACLIATPQMPGR